MKTELIQLLKQAQEASNNAKDRSVFATKVEGLDAYEDRRKYWYAKKEMALKEACKMALSMPEIAITKSWDSSAYWPCFALYFEINGLQLSFHVMNEKVIAEVPESDDIKWTQIQNTGLIIGRLAENADYSFSDWAIEVYMDIVDDWEYKIYGELALLFAIKRFSPRFKISSFPILSKIKLNTSDNTRFSLILIGKNRDEELNTTYEKCIADTVRIDAMVDKIVEARIEPIKNKVGMFRKSYYYGGGNFLLKSEKTTYEGEYIASDESNSLKKLYYNMDGEMYEWTITTKNDKHSYRVSQDSSYDYTHRGVGVIRHKANQLIKTKKGG